MTAPREVWFLRWVWIPVHWKGFVLMAVSMPVLFGMLLLVGYAFSQGWYWAGGIGGIGLFSIVVWLNIFIWKRSV